MEYETIFLGKTKVNFLTEGINEYDKRLSRYAKHSIRLIKEKRTTVFRLRQESSRKANSFSIRSPKVRFLLPLIFVDGSLHQKDWQILSVNGRLGMSERSVLLSAGPTV